MTLRLPLRRLLLLVVSVAIYCSIKAIFVVRPSQVHEETSAGTTDLHLVLDAPTSGGSDLIKSVTGEVLGAVSTRTAPRHPSARNKSSAGTTVAEEAGKRELRSLYNPVNCTTDYLGLTDYALSTLCANQTPEVCISLSCRSLLTGTGNDLYYGIARQLMSTQPLKPVPDSYFVNATRDCETFRRARGYHMTPLSPEERDFPLAFNLIVHTSAEQVEEQLRALYRPQNRFCIHVDAKADASFFAAINGIASCFDNIFIASKLERLTWGGYNRLQADINCMRDHMNTTTTNASTPWSSSSGGQWKYLINTAGLAFPLKTIGEMVKTLKIYNGANDVEGIYGNRVIKSRFEKEWEEDADHGRVRATGRRNPKPPHDIFIVRGSAYAVFSRDFVRFVLEDGKAIDLLKWSRKTWSPDELFWATLHHTYSNPHLHTPGGFSGYPSDKPWLAVYANWDDSESKCWGKRIRSVCVFGVGDLPNLTRRREFFANKFYSSFEPLALKCLSAWIRQKEFCPPAFDDAYYRSLPFIKPTS